MKKLTYLFSLVLIAAAWGCSSDDDGPRKGDGEKVTVKMSLKIKDYSKDGVATEDSRSSLDNVWILSFNSEGANLQAQKESRFDVGAEKTTEVIAGSNMKYVIVANVDAATIFQLGALSYSDFLDAVYTTSINNADAMPLVGTVNASVTSDGHNLGTVELERIAAVLNFKFTYTQSDYDVKSVTLKNVVRYPFYISKGDNSSFGTDAFVNKDAMMPDDIYHTYYISENLMGTVSGISSEKDKVTDKMATCIEIVAEKELADQRIVATYRYYPGDNKTTDFNVRRNNEYTVTETVDFEDLQDKRIIRVSRSLTIDASEANCYMLDPTSAKELAIPVTRVNRFWTSFDGGNMQNVINDGTNNGPVTKWVAREITSSSTQPLIEFVNREGTSTVESIVIKPAGNNAEGSVLIGIYNATNGEPAADASPLWSWHIWVTPYNPGSDDDDNPIPNISTNPGRSDVPGGSVFRYGNVDENATVGGANQAVMDRNLGALSNNPEDATKTWGQYYQFGRKDPLFPDFSEFADGLKSGTNESVVQSQTGQFPIAWTVQNPVTAIMIASGAHDWNDAEGRDDLWYDRNHPTSKTIYDPCPPGWRVPYAATTYVGPTINDSSEAVNGLYLLNEPNNYVPLCGYINMYSGKIFNVGSFVDYYVGTTVDTPYNARVVRFVNWEAAVNDYDEVYLGKLTYLDATMRMVARNVRCVRH